MPLPANALAALRGVITLLGDATWTYRTKTSALDAETITYSAYSANISAHLVGLRDQETFDSKRGSYVRQQVAQAKVSDAIALVPGDELKSPEGLIWEVVGRADASKGDGIARYDVKRDLGTKAAADRGGGS